MCSSCELWSKQLLLQALTNFNWYSALQKQLVVHYNVCIPRLLVWLYCVVLATMGLMGMHWLPN